MRSKENKRQRETESRCDRSPPATEGKFRITCPSHTHHTHAQTSTHTQSSNVLQISSDNTFISICIYLLFLPAETLTRPQTRSTWMGTPSQACIPICTHAAKPKTRI